MIGVEPSMPLDGRCSLWHGASVSLGDAFREATFDRTFFPRQILDDGSLG